MGVHDIVGSHWSRGFHNKIGFVRMNLMVSIINMARMTKLGYMLRTGSHTCHGFHSFLTRITSVGSITALAHISLMGYI